MKYPRWFPFPRCWLRALVTWLTASLIGLAFVPALSLATVLSVPFLAISTSGNLIVSGIAALIAVAVLFTALVLFPTFIYAHVRQIGAHLSGNQESFPLVPTVANWRKALGDELVLFAGVFVVMPFMVGVPHYLVEEVIAVVIPISFTATSYCYHFRVLFHRHQEQTRKRANVNRNRQTLYKNKRKFSSTVVDDPIELELMNLRREANEDKN